MAETPSLRRMFWEISPAPVRKFPRVRLLAGSVGVAPWTSGRAYAKARAGIPSMATLRAIDSRTSGATFNSDGLAGVRAIV